MVGEYSYVARTRDEGRLRDEQVAKSVRGKREGGYVSRERERHEGEARLGKGPLSQSLTLIAAPHHPRHKAPLARHHRTNIDPSAVVIAACSY